MKFEDWSKHDPPAEAVDLRGPLALRALVRKYGGAAPNVLEEILGQVYSLGAQSAIIEYRYIDADWRSEHSQFYAGTFRRYPSVTARLHFFRDPPLEDLRSPDAPVDFEKLHYLGYIVLRPVPGAPVGRVFLAPPPELEGCLSCAVEDQVNLLGSELRVRGVPFIAQDALLTRCAHTAAWVTAYHRHLKGSFPRLLPGDIARTVPSEIGLGRTTPSTGMTIDQIVETMTRIELPPLVYDMSGLPDGETPFRIACRYLNSGIPVTVAAGGRHAFVLVGYRRDVTAEGESLIRFIRQDDEVGPYQEVGNPWTDMYSPWEFLVVPLERKVYVSGERAEALGSEQIRSALSRSRDPSADDLRNKLESREITFRSTLVASNEFKRDLPHRGAPTLVAAVYRRMQMSRLIWVVEATDVALRNRGQRCVIAEAIIDATDHLRDMHVLALRVPGTMSRWIPENDEVLQRDDLPPIEPLASVVKRGG